MSPLEFRDTSTPAAPLVTVGENRNPRGCVNCGAPLRYVGDSFRQCSRCYEAGWPIPGDPPAKRNKTATATTRKPNLTARERQKRKEEAAKKRAKAKEERAIERKFRDAAKAERLRVRTVSVPRIPLTKRAREGLRIRLNMDIGPSRDRRRVLWARVTPHGARHSVPVGIFVAALVDSWGADFLTSKYPEVVQEVERILAQAWRRWYGREADAC